MSGIYRMERSSNFYVERTSRHGIKYFVTPSFAYYYARDNPAMDQIEEAVAADKIQELHERCEASKKYPEQKFTSLRGEQLYSSYKSWQEERIKWCSALEELVASL